MDCFSGKNDILLKKGWGSCGNINSITFSFYCTNNNLGTSVATMNNFFSAYQPNFHGLKLSILKILGLQPQISKLFLDY